MSSVRLRRIAAIAASATAVLALSACGTGFAAQTNQQYDAGVGSNERGGTIDVLNALFVDNADETATFSASILNNADEAHTLTGVKATTTNGKALEATLAGPSKIAPGAIFTPGTEGDIILSGDFPPGGFVKITLELEGTSPVTISAPVVGRKEIYADVAKKSKKAEADLEKKATEQQEQQESAQEDLGAE